MNNTESPDSKDATNPRLPEMTQAKLLAILKAKAAKRSEEELKRRREQLRESSRKYRQTEQGKQARHEQKIRAKRRKQNEVG